MEKYVEKYCSEVINFKKTKQQENCILMNHSTSSILIMETQCLLESAFIIENFDGTLYYMLCKKDKKKKKNPDLAASSDAPSTNGEVGEKTGSQQENA